MATRGKVKLKPARHRPRPSNLQIRLIDELGGPSAVARELVRRMALDEMTPQAVSMWKRRGIPFGYRIHLVKWAVEEGISVPKGFVDGIVTG